MSREQNDGVWRARPRTASAAAGHRCRASEGSWHHRALQLTFAPKATGLLGRLHTGRAAHPPYTLRTKSPPVARTQEMNVHRRKRLGRIRRFQNTLPSTIGRRDACSPCAFSTFARLSRQLARRVLSTKRLSSLGHPARPTMDSVQCNQCWRSSQTQLTWRMNRGLLAYITHSDPSGTSSSSAARGGVCVCVSGSATDRRTWLEHAPVLQSERCRLPSLP